MRGRRLGLLLLAGVLFLLTVCVQLGVGSPATGSAAVAQGAAGATSQPASTGDVKVTSKPSNWGKFSRHTGVFGDDGLGGRLWRMIGIIVVIAVLGVGGLWMARRYGPRIHQRRGRHILVVETASLGPNKNIHLLRVGKKELLVSSTREHVSMLADVTGAVGESFEETIAREGIR